MRSGSSIKTLRASAALPGAGADSDLTTVDVEDLDWLTLKITFTGGSATSAVGLRIKWNSMPDSVETAAAHGSMLSGGSLDRESYPLTTNGVTKYSQIVGLKVPGAAKEFAGAVYEAGDTANPGTCLVEAWRGRNRY